MHRFSQILGACLVFSVPPVAGAQSQPPTPSEIAQPAKPKATVYDESADAKAQIAQAVTRAARDNSRVLIQWGANWCTWCVVLDGLYKSDKAIKKELLYEYQLVHVDIGQWDKNMELAVAYGADLKSSGVPFLTVLDSAGKPVANQETSALEVKEEKKLAHDPKAVLEFLKKHEAPALSAEDVLKGGLSRAKNEGKVAFVHFGAPWCGWCHRLENWMARPEIARVLAKDFVDVKIDVDRATGGPEVLARFNKNPGGIPWFVFLDADGKPLADSNAAKGNVGFPAAPEEITHFAAMLRGVHKNITDADIAALSKSLEEERKALERR